MYAIAKLIQTLHVFDSPLQAMGVPAASTFHVSIVVSAVIVLAYIFLGGLTSAIYNEVLQFFLIVAGFSTAGPARFKKRRRMEWDQSSIADGLHALLARDGQCSRKSDGGRVVWPRHGVGLRPVVRVLVY
jgi:hypothetical protein